MKDINVQKYFIQNIGPGHHCISKIKENLNYQIRKITVSLVSIFTFRTYFAWHVLGNVMPLLLQTGSYELSQLQVVSTKINKICYIVNAIWLKKVQDHLS